MGHGPFSVAGKPRQLSRVHTSKHDLQSEDGKNWKQLMQIMDSEDMH